MLKLFGTPNDSEAIALNTKVQPHVRIINGALDEDGDSSSGIVLNGRIDPSTLRFLKVDKEYQRELAERADIFDALKEGKIVPNIEIGVRGQDFVTDGDDFLINSPAYIIDGWQRVGTALRLLDTVPEHRLRIFASIHFGTDQNWEAHRFTQLNKNVKRVSPNLHLRNMRDANNAVLTLFVLSNNERSFPLYKKVCWSQNMQRGQLISALILGTTSLTLHIHKGSMVTRSADGVASGLNRVVDNISLPVFRKNCHVFFSLINDCWPFSEIEYRHTATQLKISFLSETARMLSRHPAFWDADNCVLTVGADDRRKLAKFPINDPQVINLAGSGGKARNILYQLLIDHMNSGRRTQRLQSRFEAN